MNWSTFTRPLRPLKTSLLILTSLFYFSVSAENVLFHVECPSDTTVVCGTEIWDLSDFGTAYAFGYDGPEPILNCDVQYNLNDCGIGTIVRTFFAYDYNNNLHTCSQVITVGYNASSGSFIDWPAHYETNECGANLDPINLNDPYKEPSFSNVGDCANMMFNYVDQVFTIAEPSCIKILRKWTVIDWCTYDPNSSSGLGIWNHTQILKIVPAEGPEITCVPDITVSNGENCNSGYVQVPVPTAIGACQAEVTIVNNSIYAIEDGADASGFYPLGETEIMFTASDGCGNATMCKMKITVVDGKKPTPVCIHGISVSLGLMSDGYYFDLDPSYFNKGSFDNCTPDEQLQLSVEPTRVTCDDLGTVEVKFTVTDLAGNSEYCITYVNVQDNMNMCPSPITYSIDGLALNQDGIQIPGVYIDLTSDGLNTQVVSNEDGAYAFPEIDEGSNIELKATLDGGDDVGLSTYDLYLTAKHILGIEPFNDPFQIIAADVNNSGKVTAADMVEMRSVILGDLPGFQDMDAWRFIPNAFDLDLMNYPFEDGPNEILAIESVTADLTGLEFIGVKMGDVNFSHNAILQNEERNLMTYDLGYQLIEVGDEKFIELLSLDDQKIVGLQFNINTNSKGILENIELNNNLFEHVFQSEYNEERQLARVSMFDMNEVYFKNHRIALIPFEQGLFEELILSDEQYEAEAYTEDGKCLRINLEKVEFIANADSKEKLGISNVKIFPNPTSRMLRINLFQQEAEYAEIQIIDISGKMLLNESRYFDAGQNLFTLDLATQNLSSGIYTIRFRDNLQVLNHKIFYLKD